MFHLKLIDKTTFDALPDPQSSISATVPRAFMITAQGFEATQLRQLLDMGAGLSICKEDAFSKATILSFIEQGQDRVCLFPKGFEDQDIKTFLEKGATASIRQTDAFDMLQMLGFCGEGKERLIVEATGFEETALCKLVDNGCSMVFLKEDINLFTLTRLADEAGKRLHIHCGGYSRFRLHKFLKAGATVSLNKDNLLSNADMEELATTFKQQVHVLSTDFTDDLWLAKMKSLGALLF